MKRYRILQFDFDSRALGLSMKIEEDWPPEVRQLHEANHEKVRASVLAEFGSEAAERKLADFIELGPKSFSVLAFHNKFLVQIRAAFVIGSYYPALTGACALGERILNHLVRTLREDFASTPEYKRVVKDSFNSWSTPIEVLESWKVLLPEVAAKFRQLWDLRWRAIHFDPKTDRDDRPLALQAIRLIDQIVQGQFGAWGSMPWLLLLPGEPYIAKEAETLPFVRRVYLPNCRLVGPRHKLDIVEGRFVIHDDFPYEDREVTDEEFRKLREQQKFA